jgi:hypothetical protein
MGQGGVHLCGSAVGVRASTDDQLVASVRLKAQLSEWKFRIAKGYWCDHHEYRAPIHWTFTGPQAQEGVVKVPTWVLGDLGRSDGWCMQDLGRFQDRVCRQCGFYQRRGK